MPTIALPSAPRIAAGTLQRALLVCGILSSLVYVAANIAGALVWPEYSTASQTISELSAIDAPSRGVWLAFGFAYTVLLFAFGIGVWRTAGEQRGLRIAAGMLIAVAVVGLFWPPMHLRGTVTTLTDTLHVLVTGVVSLLILFAIGFGATAFGTRFRLYSLATIATLVVFGALTAREAPNVAANLPTPWIGVLERINLGGFLLWVAVLAVALLRRPVKEA